MGSVILGSPGWIGFALTLFGAFLVLLLIGAFRSPLPLRWKFLLFGMKAVAAGLLLLCLLDPLVTKTRFEPGENIVLLLADDTASMSVRQAAESSKLRSDWARELLDDPESSWQIRLAQDFDLRRYTFGTSLSRVEGFHDLQFDAPSSNLKASIENLLDRYKKRPLAAIYLISDGNGTDGTSLALPDDAPPVYCVVDSNSEAASEDWSIGQVSVSQTNFEDSPVTVQVGVHRVGGAPEAAIVRLEPLDASDDAEVLTETVHPDENQAMLARFQLKPPRPGVLHYRVRIAPASQEEIFENPDASRESTLANNDRIITVNRDAHQYRILYVCGRPNWEHKFLNRALADDDRLHLVSLVRIAKKEAKFEFRAKGTGSSNPLYRAFKEGESDAEVTESYDDPVLVRLNTRDAEELAGGFPKTREELFQFEAVIIDDLEAEFFTHDQMTLLDRFVSERGGGLLMLGGRDSFKNGNWDGTPVADGLPVYIDRVDSPPTGEMAWKLTREGWLEPWMRVRDNEDDEQERLGSAPLLNILSPVRSVKPGARVLAEVESVREESYPAVVVQQYGRGRTGAVLVGDLWRWFMHDASTEADDAGKTWRQTMRWLVADVPKPLEVAVETDPSGTYLQACLEVHVRDREFRPRDGARVEIEITQPDGTAVTIDAQPSLREPGLFEATHMCRIPGPYHAKVRVPGSDEEPTRLTEIGWASEPNAREFESAQVNHKYLETIARESGGEVIEVSELDASVASLSRRDLPAMQVETVPLWHRGSLLLIVLALLAGEWGLRRWRGLA